MHKLLYRLFPGLAAGLVLAGLPALIDPALAQVPAPKPKDEADLPAAQNVLNYGQLRRAEIDGYLGNPGYKHQRWY